MAKRIISEDTSAPLNPARRRAPAKKLATAPAAPATANATTTGSDAISDPKQTAPAPTQAEIAEAAYYRHLNRGGRGGDEFSDWIEAERELRRRR